LCDELLSALWDPDVHAHAGGPVHVPRFSVGSTLEQE
jgi:hypothetical protein